MANIKAIQRNEQIRIRLSGEEKDLFYGLAKELSINPTRLARNLLMIQAEKKLRNKLFYVPITKAYIKYLEVTNQQEFLKEIREEE